MTLPFKGLCGFLVWVVRMAAMPDQLARVLGSDDSSCCAGGRAGSAPHLPVLATHPAAVQAAFQAPPPFPGLWSWLLPGAEWESAGLP